jgi:hypothetical protein
MHSDGDLRGVWELFSSDFHFTSGNEDITGIKVSVMGWIIINWLEDKRTFNDDGINDWTSIDINQQVETLWNPDRFSFHWSKLSSPSSIT